MSSDDSGAGAPPPESAGAPLGTVPTAEQLMGLGALLILVVADLLGDVIVDDYGVSRVLWIVALAVVAAIWAHRMGARAAPLPYRSMLVVLGYAGALLGAREFLSDIETGSLEGATVIYALATYAGAALLALGAYRVARTE